MSSDIIKRCCSQISLDDVFNGYVERSRTALQESIQCCIFWKETYSHISKVHNKFSSDGWVLDETSIFAHIDAFIQRCKDLLEVVLGQVHACTCMHSAAVGGGRGERFLVTFQDTLALSPTSLH